MERSRTSALRLTTLGRSLSKSLAMDRSTRTRGDDAVAASWVSGAGCTLHTYRLSTRRDSDSWLYVAPSATTVSTYLDRSLKVPARPEVALSYNAFQTLARASVLLPHRSNSCFVT